MASVRSSALCRKPMSGEHKSSVWDRPTALLKHRAKWQILRIVCFAALSTAQPSWPGSFPVSISREISSAPSRHVS